MGLRSERKSIVYFNTWSIEVLLLLITVFLLLVSYQIAKSSIEVQMKEMEWRIQEDEYLDKEASHLHLVIKYTSQRRLYHDSLSQRDFDMLEFDLRNQILDIDREIPELNLQDAFFSNLAIQFLNLKRYFTGEVPYPNAWRKRAVKLLFMSYQLERKKEYQKALFVYDLMLENKVPKDMLGAVLLHRAFCMAILGDITGAEKIYKGLIQKYPGEDVGFTAAELLHFLKEFEGEKNRIANSNMILKAKAKYFVKLLKCSEAMKAIDDAGAASPKDVPYLEYYRGVCLEQMGKKDQALFAYGTSIGSSGRTELSKDANRRIFMIGAEQKKTESIRNLALKINTFLKDTLLDSISTQTRFPEKSDVLEEFDELEKIEESGEDERWKEVEELEEEKEIPELTGKEIIPQDIALEEAITESFIKKIDSLEQAISTKLTVESVKKTPKVEKKVKPTPNWIPKDTRVRVFTKNGEAFYGVLQTPSNVPIIRLQTMIGVLPIKQEDIKSIIKQ